MSSKLVDLDLVCMRGKKHDGMTVYVRQHSKLESTLVTRVRSAAAFAACVGEKAEFLDSLADASVVIKPPSLSVSSITALLQF